MCRFRVGLGSPGADIGYVYKLSVTPYYAYSSSQGCQLIGLPIILPL